MVICEVVYMSCETIPVRKCVYGKMCERLCEYSDFESYKQEKGHENTSGT